MRCVVVGAGRLGSAVGNALTRRGVDTLVVSRSTGVDVTAPGLDPDLFDGVGAVVEATDVFTRRADRAAEFFLSSTRTINAAARQVGARHVLVSIVNCDDPRLRGNGYYAAKADQERVAAEENENLTIIRSTLWYEFARQNLERMKVGVVSVIPRMTVKPVAVDSVADVIAQSVLGERPEERIDVCGPDEMTLWQMTKALPDKRCLPVSVPVPGAAGRAMRDGTLLPGARCEVVGPAFDTWLRDHTAPAFCESRASERFGQAPVRSPGSGR